MRQKLLQIFLHITEFDKKEAEKMLKTFQEGKLASHPMMHYFDGEWPDEHSTLMSIEHPVRLINDSKQWFDYLYNAFRFKKCTPIAKWLQTFDVTELKDFFLIKFNSRHKNSPFLMRVFYHLNEQNVDLTEIIHQFNYEALRVIIAQTSKNKNANHTLVEDLIHQHMMMMRPNTYYSIDSNAFLHNRHFFQQPHLYLTHIRSLFRGRKIRGKIEFITHLFNKIDHNTWLFIAEQELPQSISNSDKISAFIGNNVLNGTGFWPLIAMRITQKGKPTYDQIVNKLTTEETDAIHAYSALNELTTIRWTDFWLSRYSMCEQEIDVIYG